MKNRRTLYKLATLVILLAAVGIIFFRPLPIVSARTNPCYSCGITYRLDVFVVPYRVIYRNNINYDLSHDCVIYDILSRHYARRAFNIPTGRLINFGECELFRIRLTCRIRTMHISVGTNTVVFFSHDDIIVRRIIDPTSLIDELLSVLSPYLLNE